jgi:hypothetical protein
MPHHACPNCGTYQGRQVLELEAEKPAPKKEKAAKQGAEEKPKS